MARDFLPLSVVAQVLAIDLTEAYNLVRAGDLPAIKVGGHAQWRVDAAILDAYLRHDRQRQDGAAQGRPRPASARIPWEAAATEAR